MECTVCIEKITKRRFAVECPYCENAEVCVICLDTYLSLVGQPGGGDGCMMCKKSWDCDFIDYMFGPETADTITMYRNKKLWDREEALFPVTQPLVKYEKFKEKISQENKMLDSMLAIFQRKVTELRIDIDINNNKLHRAKPDDIHHKNYIQKCPRQGSSPEDSCKGFIDDKDWTCGICGLQVCKRCLVEIKSGKDGVLSGHTCTSNNIKSAELIMAETKPCPTCAARIYKIDGCEQMFCTACTTAFNWTSLKIDHGNVHNPHYYEFVRQGKIKVNERRVYGEIPCGGIPQYQTLHLTLLRNPEYAYYDDKFRIYHRRASEVEDYIEHLVDLKNLDIFFTDLRVKYLLNQFTKPQYEQAIIDQEKYNTQCKDEYTILSTLITLFAERFRDIAERGRAISNMLDATKRTRIGNLRILPLMQRRKLFKTYLDGMLKDYRECTNIINQSLETVGLETINFTNPDVYYRGLREAEIAEFHNHGQNDDHGDSDSDREDFGDFDSDSD